MASPVKFSRVVSLNSDELTDSVFNKNWAKISPFFSPAEIFSPATIDRGKHLIDIKALEKLNRFREYVQEALYVNHAGLTLRGVRSPKEQITLGQTNRHAAELSMHVGGKAFDLSSPGLTVDQLGLAAKDFGWSAVGINPKAGFVHVDTRELFGGKPIYFVY